MLLESWCEKKTDIDIPGYKSFNYYRKFRNKKARRHSEGIALYIKECITHHVTIVKNNFDTILWLKIDENAFNLQTDVYLCIV